MADRYEITFGEVRSQRSRIKSANSLGHFSVSFVVKPPIKFLSETASQELSGYVLAAWQRLDPDYLYIQPIDSEPSAYSNKALLSFSHELADGSGIVGVVSGHFNRKELGLEHLKQAFDIVLNGETPSQ